MMLTSQRQQLFAGQQAAGLVAPRSHAARPGMQRLHLAPAATAALHRQPKRMRTQRVTCQAAVAEAPKEDKFDPQVCVVLGTQWGDEGKGKLVDILAQEYEIVARAQVRREPVGGRGAGGTAGWQG